MMLGTFLFTGCVGGEGRPVWLLCGAKTWLLCKVLAEMWSFEWVLQPKGAPAECSGWFWFWHGGSLCWVWNCPHIAVGWADGLWCESTACFWVCHRESCLGEVAPTVELISLKPAEIFQNPKMLLMKMSPALWMLGSHLLPGFSTLFTNKWDYCW